MSEHDDQARERLEERYATLVNAINGIVWEADAATFQFLFVSSQAERMLGYPVREWLEDPDFWRHHTHPDDAEWCSDFCMSATARGEEHEFEYRMIAADGRIVWLRDIVTPTVDPDGTRRLRGLMIDITERKLAEVALRESELRLQVLAHATNDAVWDWDITRDVVWWNEGLTTLFGYTPETVDRSVEWWSERVHADDRPGVLASLDAVLATGGGADWRSEYRFARADGSYAYVIDRGRVIRDSGGEPHRMIGSLVDMTQRRQMEEALRFSEARFQAAFKAGPHPSLIAALDTDEILDVNERFVEAFGYDRDEVVRRSTVEIGLWPSPAERDRLVAILETEGYARDVPMRTRTLGGAARDVMLSAALVPVEGRPCMIVAAHDVTDQKRLEEQLRLAQRMEAVGRLAGGVAHDFNNLLTVISGYTDLALRELDGSDPVRNFIVEVRKAGERASRLTRQLLAFSRRQILEPRVLDLNEVVAELSMMLRRLIGEDVELLLTLDPAIARVRADPGQIEQVIANLAVNARDAMPEGGTLTIETRRVERDGAECVLLAVTDTGVGMDEETRAHAFEPFFTTKEVGKGTGLGLATVYGIVVQSGGAIELEAKPGSGTAVRLYLPASRNTGDLARRAQSEPATARGSETVLVVEDEPAVRRLAVEALRTHGYRVLEAAGAHEATALSESYGEPIDLMLTDVVMPTVNGRELAERLTRERPDLKVVFMSGYTDDAIVRHGVLEEGVSFIGKPFTPSDLARKIRETLDAREPLGDRPI